MFTVVVVSFCYFFFVESVEMLITLINTILSLSTVPVLFEFLHLSFEVEFLMDIYASVFSICHAADVPVPVLNNHSLHGGGDCCRGIPFPWQPYVPARCC